MILHHPQKSTKHQRFACWNLALLGVLGLNAIHLVAADDLGDSSNRADASQIETADGILTGPSAVPDTNVTPANDGFVPEAIESPADGMIENRSELKSDQSPASELESLSKKLAALQADWDEFQGGIKAESAAKKKKSSYKLNGRVHLDQWTFSDTDPGINVIENQDPGFSPENRWLFRRIRLELAGEVPQNMLWRIQVDFNNPNEPEIKDVYLGWTNLPNNQTLLLGNQKRPLGLDAIDSSRFTVFAERPLAVEAFNEDARRFGLCMYGHNNDESVGWSYGIYNLENISEDGRFIGDSYQMGGYSRLWSSPWYDETSGGRGYLHLGIAGAVAKPDGDVGPQDTNSNEARFRSRPLARSDQRWLNTTRIPGADWYEHIGFEAILNLGSLQFTGEYILTPLQRNAQPGANFPTDPADLPGYVFDDTIDQNLFFHGGYVQASYFLTGEFIPYERSSGTIDRVTPHENFFLVDRIKGGRGSGWGAWQIAARYDFLDLTDGGVNGGVGNMVTGGLNWHWTPYSKVQNNLVYGNIDSSGLANINGGTAVDAGDFLIFGSRFMIDF